MPEATRAHTAAYTRSTIGSNATSTVHWVDRLHGPMTAWVILAISLIITVVAWKIASDYAENRARERFLFQIEEAQNAIAKRFINYEQVLRGGLGLFKASSSVNRAEWHEYVDTLKIDTFFPGTLGVGYSVWLSPQELPTHIRQVQAEGFPSFSVRPEGVRDHYSSIVFLEPFNHRNKRAFGYDMYSDAVRREAMERARDTGETAISGKVTLVQEITTDVQHGFLIYVPHYKREVRTLDERRANLAGFIYSALRIGDLMHGILGVGLPELDFSIYDGADKADTNLMYRSHNSPAHVTSGVPPQFQSTRALNIGGRSWAIEYHTNERFDKAMSSSQPLFVASGGIVIDLLLFYIILSLGRLRNRAQRLADERMQTLQAQEVRFKTITDNASDGIVTLDEQGVITYFNQAAQKMFGYTEEAILARPLRLLIPIAHHGTIAAAMRQLTLTDAGSRHSGQIEVEGIASDMKLFPLELSISRVSNACNNSFTVITRDISERKRIENMKSEFISTVSHELRTPLAAISGSLSLVENGVLGPISEKAMTLIKTASRNCTRLNTLVNDILDSDKLASGTMRFDIKPCDILPLVTHAIEVNQPFAARAGVSIRLDESQSATLMVDPDRFIQVITNLLANAIKFSHEGDTVEVGVQLTPTHARIHVTDHGNGIPESFRGKIFEKFAQADSTDARKFGGTGLGLSIVKYIIEQFDGKVDFTSVPNQATTFFLDIPLHVAADSLAS